MVLRNFKSARRVALPFFYSLVASVYTNFTNQHFTPLPLFIIHIIARMMAIIIKRTTMMVEIETATITTADRGASLASNNTVS